MIGIKYVGAFPNPSGYGEAARNFITALFVAGANVTCESVSQMSESTTYGINGAIYKQLENRKIDYKFNIIHLTPDLYAQYHEEGKYNIGHLFFETDSLPKEWIVGCNLMDEIWTASATQAEMIKKSGVTVPIYSFPQPIDTTKAYEIISPFTTNYTHDFTFYSCFQWIKRKNPEVLLKAYWKEFEGNDEVTLLIKTYRITYIDSEYQLIKNDIALWKKELNLKHYPKVYLVHKLLSTNDMYRFHEMGDVFINPSSGEGWNRVMQEAMLLDKPTISGDNGGITDYLTPSYYMKVKSHKVQAKEQSQIPWYTQDMQWWELDEEDLRLAMRGMYQKQKETKRSAKLAQDYIIDNFSYKSIGQRMIDALKIL